MREGLATPSVSIPAVYGHAYLRTTPHRTVLPPLPTILYARVSTADPPADDGLTGMLVANNTLAALMATEIRSVPT